MNAGCCIVRPPKMQKKSAGRSASAYQIDTTLQTGTECTLRRDSGKCKLDFLQ